MKLEIVERASGEDVARLLQMYMVRFWATQRGVEKMNAVMDLREIFFKNRVIALMSNPAVMKTLSTKNKMGKKQAPALATATLSPSKKKSKEASRVQVSVPGNPSL
jgi:hypothetical protein